MTLQSVFLWGASAASLVTLLVHLFAGGVAVARPLLADRSLPRAAKWLAYYCWHIASAAILFMGAAFARLAVASDGAAPRDAVVGLAAFAAALSALSVWTAAKGGIAPLRFPSTSLFALVAALGAAAAVAGAA